MNLFFTKINYKNFEIYTPLKLGEWNNISCLKMNKNKMSF